MTLLAACLLGYLAAVVRREYRRFSHEVDLMLAEARRARTRWAPK